MKTYFKVLVAALVLSTTLFSCDSDDKDDKKVVLKNEIEVDAKFYEIESTLGLIDSEEEVVAVAFIGKGLTAKFVDEDLEVKGAGNYLSVEFKYDEDGLKTGTYDYIADVAAEDEDDFDSFEYFDAKTELAQTKFTLVTGSIEVSKDSNGEYIIDGLFINIEKKVLKVHYEGKIEFTEVETVEVEEETKQ